MKQFLLALFLLGGAGPVLAQSPADFFNQIRGFWKNLPPKGSVPAPEEESYFEFLPGGEIVVSINNGSAEKPVIAEMGRGKVTLLKAGDPAMVLILLNDEFSTNAISVKSDRLTIYSFHEKTKKLVEKVVMQKIKRP